MNWIRKAPIAHRGLHSNNSEIPENSLMAFEEAIKYGYAIELDVQITKDEEVVVFHDNTLSRICGVNHQISEVSLEFLKNLHLLNSKEKIPTLKEALSLINNKVPVLIEIKNNNRLIGLIESKTINTLKEYTGEIAIQSFNPYTINWFRNNYPEIPRGQLSSQMEAINKSILKKIFYRYMLFNIICKPHFIAYEKNSINSIFLQIIRKTGIPILCWTIKSKKEEKRALPYCDNIIFEGFKP